MQLTGIVVSMFPSSNQYVGYFGEIQAGKDTYTWNSSLVFRNFSFMEVGAQVYFRVVNYKYAIDIGRIDKHRVKNKKPTLTGGLYYL